MKLRISLFVILLLSFWYSCSHPYQQGKRVYQNYCQNCHGENGEGFRSLYPDIRSSALWETPEQLACLIRYGSNKLNLTQEGEIPMPPVEGLNEVAITNVINYLLHEWNQAEPLNIQEVNKQLEECK